MAEQLLTPNEAAYVAGVPLREVYKVARERLPPELLVKTGAGLLFTKVAAICVRIDHGLPRDVPVEVRRGVYAAIERNPRARKVEHRTGLLSYVIDAAAAEKAIAVDLAAYRAALALVDEDPAIQGGAAIFKGTRILVHTIADLLAAGASHEELKEDYPRLTDAMLAAAPIYKRSRPRRGRPRSPRWREGAATEARYQPRSPG